jgi:hypothetical protein
MMSQGNSGTSGEYMEIEKVTIDRILSEKIEKCLGEEKKFKADKVKRWSESICRECLRDLVKLQKTFKFIVTCCINQRTGGGLVQHSSCFADPLHDLVTTVHWMNDAVHCIVTVYCLTLF